ncbi:histone acetyltransferases subunit 3-domain-containing protein [Protomyces lactucae-debilis]|uniref:Histone acetyltransferases subunit 3-domain-containing protein n=1 Tax=Protomyces lactucae-debilis TaxID=2754530 RepID=A0A1Y2FEV1_PROLT|nr:histone acetyltransferases subunit 3-domain-containing protein [Protomyces lactucae-debilis]ORY82480.1 histone acetyltransferases subunit 3-domain-containing protein [Protomyces lactucae-debilis]
MTRISVPILTDLKEELDLPEGLNAVIAQSTVPPSAELNALNASLADLAASAQARADALKRDIELLQQHYLSLKQKVKRDKEKADRLAAEAAVAELAEADAQTDSKRSAVSAARHEFDEDIIKSEAASPGRTQASRRPGSAERQIDAMLPSEDRAAPIHAAHSGDIAEMQRRLGVAAYPTVDLTPLLPGKPSEDDYTKGKVPNQIAITTFYTSIEPHFRPFTEEDLGWLRDKGDQLGPFIIPPLGPHYTEVWNEMDETPPPKAEVSQRPKESAEALNDDNVFADAVSCGPLTSRLISALLKEEGAAQRPAEEEPEKDKELRAAPFKMDYAEVEEKLAGELSFIGLLESRPIDWNQTSDDEISANLRMLQAELKTQSTLNAARKRKLMELTTDEMAKDEYTTILDDLDKQVEQAFLKRSRSIKAKKKRITGEKGVAVNKVGMGASMRSQMDKRQKWITKIGSVVKKESTMAPPGYFDSVNVAEDDEEEES